MNHETKLECGHPADCLHNYQLGTREVMVCAWCDEVASLRRDNESMKSVLEEKAYVIKNGGTLVIPPEVTRIGYVSIHAGGMMKQETPVDLPHITFPVNEAKSCEWGRSKVV